MESLLDNFFLHPMLFIGGSFGFLGALALLVFLAGFLGGAPNLFSMNEADLHMHHARTRAIWGAGWLMILFGFWRLVVFISGSGSAADVWLAIVLISPAWITLLFKLFYPNGSNGTNGTKKH